MTDREEIIRRAVSTYGIDAQILMAIEEMSELTKALCKERRTRSIDDLNVRSKAMENIAEEIADVQIIDKAIEIIKSRCIDAGYPENYKDWNDERFRLLGIMRFDGGIDAVLKFASTAEILPFQEKKETRGYA